MKPIMVVAGLLALLRVESVGAQSQTNDGAHQNTQIVYSIDELPLGGRVRRDSAIYQQYKCAPSQQFLDLTWCHKQIQVSVLRETINVSTTLMHTDDGTAVYVNRFVRPAHFAPDDVRTEINRLSVKFGKPSKILRLPPQAGLQAAIIVVWGGSTLEPLTDLEVSNRVAGLRSANGMLVDYIGDFQKSTQLHLPIFRIGGQAGYIWSASYDASGRGHLRLTTADASLFSSSGQIGCNGSACNERLIPNTVEPNSPVGAAHDGNTPSSETSNLDTDLVKRSDVFSQSPSQSIKRGAEEAKQANAASAQVQVLNGSRPTESTRATFVSNAWAAVSSEQMSCLEAALRQSGQPDVQTFVKRQIGPLDPPVGQILLKCRLDRQHLAQADQVIRPFLQWFETDFLKEPGASAAFDRCTATLSAYESKLLERMNSQAAAAVSKTDQDRFLASIRGLTATKQTSTYVACVKLFIANLKIAGSASGYFADEISALNGRLTEPGFDLTERAQARLKDFTDQGAKQFLRTISLEDIPDSQLNTEIESAAQQISIGYLSCFVTKDWNPANSACHGTVVEISLTNAVSSTITTNK